LGRGREANDVRTRDEVRHTFKRDSAVGALEELASGACVYEIAVVRIHRARLGAGRCGTGADRKTGGGAQGPRPVVSTVSAYVIFSARGAVDLKWIVGVHHHWSAIAILSKMPIVSGVGGPMSRQARVLAPSEREAVVSGAPPADVNSQEKIRGDRIPARGTIQVLPVRYLTVRIGRYAAVSTDVQPRGLSRPVRSRAEDHRVMVPVDLRGSIDRRRSAGKFGEGCSSGC
jgi:hypothetical protein